MEGTARSKSADSVILDLGAGTRSTMARPAFGQEPTTKWLSWTLPGHPQRSQRPSETAPEQSRLALPRRRASESDVKKNASSENSDKFGSSF